MNNIKRTRTKKPLKLKQSTIDSIIDKVARHTTVHKSYLLDIHNKKYYKEQNLLIKLLRSEGMSALYLAKMYKCHLSTIYNRLDLK